MDYHDRTEFDRWIVYGGTRYEDFARSFTRPYRTESRLESLATTVVSLVRRMKDSQIGLEKESEMKREEIVKQLNGITTELENVRPAFAHYPTSHELGRRDI